MHAMGQNGGHSAELCIERLTRKLSEVEAVVTASEGKANHMKKERDAAKTENEKLRKEVAKLKNELLKVRMNSALKKKEITDVLHVKDGSEGAGNSVIVLETEIPILRKDYGDATARKKKTNLHLKEQRHGYLGKFNLFFSCASFVIRVILLHPSPSLVLTGLLFLAEPHTLENLV